MATDLQAMFEKIDRQKKDLLEILRTLGEGVLVLDEGGQIILLNRAAEEFLGLTDSDVRGKDVLALLTIPEIRELLQEPDFDHIEYRQNEKFFHAELFTIPTLNQRLIVIRDITEHRNIQQTKTDLVTNVSHELCTPLSLIKGFAETLEGEPLTDDQRKYVDIIARHTERMIALVRDLLTLSRIEGAERLEGEKLDLAALTEEIVLLFKPKADEKELSIEFNSPDSVPVIHGDKSLLEIAISNLIDNAIKYNNRGGKIIIDLTFENDKIILNIADTGIGIPEDELERVFERFYTVDKSRSRELFGTGLGLSIVKHIVLLHGGEIAVESAAGEGSVFTINLPI